MHFLFIYVFYVYLKKSEFVTKLLVITIKLFSYKNACQIASEIFVFSLIT